MKMYIGGRWIEKAQRIDVINPFDGSVIDTVPKGDLEDIDAAMESATRGAKVMAAMPGYDRYLILKKASDLLEERTEDFARTISLEEGKVITEARVEVARGVQTLMLSGEEAKRLHGETVPMDGAPGGNTRFGFTMRVPCGVVIAITPFNFPLNLVCHKVGPALAGGNSVVLKPATDTPLSGIKVTELLLEAGVPPEALQCVTGSGGEIGDALCSDRRARKITFTGSRDVGEHICHVAGLKKVTMELGSNAPVIIMPDADISKVVEAVTTTGYANAGQVCISAQRILTNEEIYGDFLDALVPSVESITSGNPLDEKIKMGPMIRESDAIRVNEWVGEAVSEGGRVLAGGERDGAFHQPTIIADVNPKMRISCDELFGPAVAVTPFSDIDEAIASANDSNYGLSAGIFTENIDWAMKFAREVDSGNLMINWGPMWRADLMPYGGLKESGFGKEGPRYAVEEMTELKLVCFNLS